MKKIILGLLLPIFLVTGVFAYTPTEKDLKVVKVLKVLVNKMPEKKLKILKAIIPIALKKKDENSKEYFLLSSLQKTIKNQPLNTSFSKKSDIKTDKKNIGSEEIDPTWTKFEGKTDEYDCNYFNYFGIIECKAEGYLSKNKKKVGTWKVFAKVDIYDKDGYDVIGSKWQLKSEITYKDGQRNGYTKNYGYEGNIESEGNYIPYRGNMKDLSFKIGYWKYYYPNGKLGKEVTYIDKGGNGGRTENGVRKYYHENGKLREEGNYKNGQRVGTWKLYYEDGTLEQECGSKYKEGNGKFGQKHGLCKEYDEDGKLKKKGNYENGKAVGVWKERYEGELNEEVNCSEANYRLCGHCGGFYAESSQLPSENL